MEYIVILTEAEDKALSYIALSQQDWIDNAVHERCRVAIDEIVKICVEKCLETNTQIPGSKDDMVLLAFENGWVKTGVEQNNESTQIV
jgi:hypothetical protein